MTPGLQLNGTIQEQIQDFKLGGGGCLKKLCRAEGGVNIFGVFRVKNHDFTPKNHIFSNCGGRRKIFWGVWCEKSRFYAQKILFFPILGGGHAPGVPPPPPPPWIRPCYSFLLINTTSGYLDHFDVIWYIYSNYISQMLGY